MFRGKFFHTVDPKGRLSIPAKFREYLGEAFVITMGMDDCLLAYDLETWKAFEEKLTDVDMLDDDAMDLVRFIIGNVQDVTRDKQGRVLLTDDTRTSAEIEKDVVINGMGNHFEIWPLDKWNERMGAVIADKAALKKRLRESGHKLTIS